MQGVDFPPIAAEQSVSLEISENAMGELLTHGWDTNVVSLLGVFVAGVMMSVNPGALPLIPIITGYVLGAEPRRGRLRLAAFLAGIVVAGMALGLVFATASGLIGTFIGPVWNGVIGIVLVVMGLRLLRLVRFKGIAVRTARRQVTTPLAAFFFGIPFVFAL